MRETEPDLGPILHPGRRVTCLHGIAWQCPALNPPMPPLHLLTMLTSWLWPAGPPLVILFLLLLHGLHPALARQVPALLPLLFLESPECICSPPQDLGRSPALFYTLFFPLGVACPADSWSPDLGLALS